MDGPPRSTACSRTPAQRVRLDLMLGALWLVVTLPFRLLAWVVEMLGRLSSAALGFVFMVVGAALGAGSLYLIGIPLFVVGMLLLLRALGCWSPPPPR